ncbi:MAG: methionine--tRNA ligase [Bacilli bacterium]|nr:methionine--tRNA ligase [Bacilli bacterium]
MEKYYITTAIVYASGKPHIGNVYEVVLADSIARYKRLKGFDVYFQTGTDEHGEKVHIKAQENNVTEQDYVDNISKIVRENYDMLNISYDSFARTSDIKHKEIVSNIFQKLYDKGDIYKDVYEGWYCIPCESFYTDLQLIDGKCPDCGRNVEKKKEESYFLKLSNYTDKLLDYIEKNPLFLQPDFRKTEIINNFIKPGLQDLCVTRSSFDWGVKVPFDKNNVIYVWIDALSNYITFLDYDINNKSEKFNKYWPADLQIIGKDIYRFHAIYWPILLLALEEELPKTIFGHQWLISDKEKMSKSRGNVLYADELVNDFGLDQIRYYILSSMPITSDGLISKELIKEKINSDLANTLGNLINRTIAMSLKYFDGIVKKTGKNDEIDNKFIEEVSKTPKKVDEAIEKTNISLALSNIIDLARICNKYIDDTTPWILAKDENYDKLNNVLYNIIESIRIIGILLKPFLPDTSNKIINSINTKIISYDSIYKFGNLENNITVEKIDILFTRIE